MPGVHLLHVTLLQGKVKHLEVLLYVFHPPGLGDGHDPLLETPSEKHLSRGPTIHGGDGSQSRIAQDVAFPERAVALEEDPVVPAVLVKGLGKLERVELDLIHERGDRRVLDEGLQVPLEEVGDSNRSTEAFVEELLHLAPHSLPPC